MRTKVERETERERERGGGEHETYTILICSRKHTFIDSTTL